MMSFDRHLEKLALIGGNAIVILAFAVASISFTEGAPHATSARYPDGWRAPQQARHDAADPNALARADWARSWIDAR
jgi:hypothetical protein